MKISEIKNKMFNLSDLKGLISENMSIENLSWANIFKRHPEFLGPEYEFQNAEQMFQNPELLAAMAEDDPGSYSPEQVATFNGKKKGYLFGSSGPGGYKQKRLAFIQAMEREKEKAASPKVAQPVDAMAALANGEGIPSDDDSKNAVTAQKNTKLLYDFFMNNGGASLAYSDEMETNEGLLREYVDACLNLVYSAGELIGSDGRPLKNFYPYELRVGSVKNPFLLFLFFHFVTYGNQTGLNFGQGVGLKKTERIHNYVETNMEPGSVSEYAKYVTNRIGKERSGNNFITIDNVFSTLLSFGKTSGERFKMAVNNGRVSAILKGKGLDGDELAYARSMVYLGKYQEAMSVQISQDELNFIGSTFGYDPGKLFDPLSKITDGLITARLGKYCSGGNTESLGKFSRPAMTGKEELQTPAERIFTEVRAFRNVLDLDFEKVLGASGRNVLGVRGQATPEKIELLLGPAALGLAKLQEDAERRGYFGERIPQAINGLSTLYEAEIKKIGVDTTKGDEDATQQRDEVKLWQLLRKDADTKTQDEIFYYLLAASDQDTVWSQEYNRYDREEREQTEGGLGAKSIDILGKKTNKNGIETVLCFEYQGEQHYHPVNVRPADYQYSLFSTMLEDVFEECGFSTEKSGKRKYHYGYESVDPVVTKNSIIKVFNSYVNKLRNYLTAHTLSGDKIISRNFRLVSEGASVKSVNIKALDKFTLKEALDYFIEVTTKWANNVDVFENPPLKGIVPYLCSPCRFFDEVQTALDIERDRVKSSIMTKRMSTAGWSMAYVTPAVKDTNSSMFTSDDYQYTLNLAGGNARVFQWTPEGRDEMAQYLVRMGFRTPQSNGSAARIPESTNSLFQQIITEIISENYL